MHGKAQTGTDMLERIAALLLALADLAEQAAGRSVLVRWLVLWSLWQAGEVARDFVAGAASNAAGRPSARIAVRHGHDPADAMALAASLRRLARLVRNMAALIRLRRVAMPGRARDDRDVLARSGSAFAPVELRDTS